MRVKLWPKWVHPFRFWMRRESRSKYRGDRYTAFTSKRAYKGRNLRAVSLIIRPGTKAAGAVIVTPTQAVQEARRAQQAAQRRRML